jgi:3-isopropylmalate/(R)-2-methylmalate dehydratase small subunit
MHQIRRQHQHDVIIPARYLNTFDADELGRHCMEDLDASFHARLKGGDIIAAGKNFGCGSSREHAPLAIKANASYASSLRALRASSTATPSTSGCPSSNRRSRRRVRIGRRLRNRLRRGEARNLRAANLQYRTVPPFLSDIIRCGGLMNMAKNMSGGSRE